MMMHIHCQRINNKKKRKRDGEQGMQCKLNSSRYVMKRANVPLPI
jgi:hypothetical protein